MKIKSVKMLDIDKLFNVKFNKKYPVLSCAAAIFGIVLGVILETVSESVKNKTTDAFSQFINQNFTRSIWEIFLSSFFINMLIIVYLIFLGFSSIGFGFVYFAPAFKGLGIGSICSYIYSTFLFKGVAYCALIIFPSSLIALTAIILGCNESVQMSHDILNLIRKNGDTQARVKLDLYGLRFAVIIFIVALSSLVYAVGAALFFRLL